MPTESAAEMWDRADGAALLGEARRRAGLTMAQLADLAGVAPSMISAYERRVRQATLPTLERLLRAAGFELWTRLEPFGTAPRREDPFAEQRRVLLPYLDAREAALHPEPDPTSSRTAVPGRA